MEFLLFGKLGESSSSSVESYPLDSWCPVIIADEPAPPWRAVVLPPGSAPLPLAPLLLPPPSRPVVMVA